MTEEGKSEEKEGKREEEDNDVGKEGDFFNNILVLHITTGV